MKQFYQYLLLILISITFIWVSDITNTKNNIEIPNGSVAGTEDNPFGASEYRYQMIKGKADFINPLSRKRAIDYTKKHLINNSLKKGESIDTWEAIGPGNIGGRIRSIVINPANTQEILVGAVAGGIWKTTDGGAHWTPKIDDGDPISISCMVNDGNTVYAGTGEGWSNIDAVYGGGIYKSTDFGETWTLLPSTLSNDGWDFKTVRSIRLDANGNVYAVTRAINYKGGVGDYYSNGGLWKSTDGGNSWTKISSPNLLRYYTGTDVIPVTSQIILFATYAGDMFRTSDNGATWDSVLTGLPTDQESFNRIAMAQDPNDANTVYAVYSARSSGSPYYGLRGIYKTTDGGLSWTELNRPGNLLSTGGSYLGGQGWYDNVISVDPHNSQNIYVGGVEDMKSTDGGNHWTQISYWTIGSPYVHADHHAIVFDPVTANVVYDGDDGGIFKTTDGGSHWTALNNGLQITQFYGGATEANGTNYQGGTQDNGHLKYNGSGTNWSEVQGGDGGYAEISQSNSQVAYEEYVYLQIDKTTDGGNTWNDATNGLTDAGDGNVCLFIAPFSMNPENSDVLIAGSDNVWITTDAAANWSSSSATLSTDENVSAVTIVNASAPYLAFAGTTDGKVFKSTNSTAPVAGGGEGLAKTNATWTEITPPGNNGAWVRRITVDLNDKNKIYVCYSGYNNDGVSPSRHVYYSSDQGANWSDISGNLPDVPVHSLVIDNDNPQKLYIGTETGVYETSDRGGTWVKRGNGMPDYAPVDQLVLQSGTNELFAFTHGRSVFKTISPLPVELTTFTAQVNSNNVELNWSTATEVNNYGFDVERKFGKKDWEKVSFIEGHGNSNSAKYYSFSDKGIEKVGKVYYRLKQLDIDGTFEYSKTIEAEINAPNNFELSQNYPNPFNPTTTIKYSVPTVETQDFASVQLKVYDVLGKEIATLVNQQQKPGIYKVQFDASNLASGIYYYQLKTKNTVKIRKMLLLK